MINISSVQGLVASPYKVAYISAKHGLEGGTRGVTSNCIRPAYVRAPLVEKRLVEPEEAAELGAFLCAPQASFITGASLTMEGGATAH